MQLQQLRYVIAAAQFGSFRAAAQKLYVSQSSISAAVKDLEDETHTTIFERSRRGITVTDEGAELISYAKRVLHEADVMASRYLNNGRDETHIVISSLHNLLVTKAFGDFLEVHDQESCNFVLHETYTNQVIRDVAEGESDVGIIYKSNFNDQAVEQALENGHLTFTPLFTARPFVVLGDNHPLASAPRLRPEQLAPYDRYELEQGFETSSFYETEPISGIPYRRNIVLGDNSSLAALLAEHNGYSITTGLSPANRSLTLIPLVSDEHMVIGLIRVRGRRATDAFNEFTLLLGRRVVAEGDNEQIEPTDEAYRLAHLHRPTRHKEPQA